MIIARQQKVNNFGCEICADKAGYYMYLPAVFYWGFTAEKYPEGFDHEHGDGFHINKEDNMVVTKFTCGVALMLSPFYALGVLLAWIFSWPVQPYSSYFLFFVNLGAAFYLVVGIYFLRKWLMNFVDDNAALWTVLAIFFGTNLFYYTLDESLMSHLYSFTLFSALLYGWQLYNNERRFKYFLLFMIALSLSILTRPTNILFLPIAVLTGSNNLQVLKQKVQLLLRPYNLLTGLIIFCAVMIPQILYWKFAFGSYFVWSYEGEGFTYWDKPQLLSVWFSPQSGVFTYTPLVLLSLFFSGIMIFRKEKTGLLPVLVFLLVSYMCASWYNPFFGVCNFGKRPMIEYYPVILLPLSYMIMKLQTYSVELKRWIIGITLVLVYYNLALFLAFNTCFFGQPWEWPKFAELLKKAFLFM